MIRRNWSTALLDYGRLATLQLGNPRPPWRYFNREVEGLWARTGSPAQVTGPFRVTLNFDPKLRGCGSTFTAFVMEHEFAHMTGKHPFWLMMTLLLCFPLYPLVLVWQERIADRAAARLFPPSVFLSVATRLHRKGAIQRLVYGDPLRRTQRAYRLTEEGIARWAAASIMVAATK
jgi:Zn-dependent protease with chaperone function